MNARTEFQIILGKDGKPAFVVVPFEEFEKMKSVQNASTVPNNVVNLSFDKNLTPMAAWREHLGITQVQVASRMNITQAAYAQMERVKKPRKATLQKVADALGLTVEQLRW
jgi:predicted transcriptional regulator